MKNLIIFRTSLKSKYHNGDYEADYKAAYESENMNALAKLISLHLSPALIRLKTIDDKKQCFVVLKDLEKEIEIRLPRPTKIAEGRLIYSGNMDHLLRMQKAVVENLEKVFPLKRSGRNDDLTRIILGEVN